MRHRNRVKKLNRPKAHRTRLLENLACAAFTHYGIVTTQTRAKEASKFIEKLITSAKLGTLGARRNIFAKLGDKKIVQKLFDNIAPTFQDRKGGYTRIIHLGPRKGDGASLVLLELLGFEDERKRRHEEREEKRKEREEHELKGETG